MYHKIGPWHLAHVVPNRSSVSCTCANLGYSPHHRSNLTFSPQRKYFSQEKNGGPFKPNQKMEVFCVVFISNVLIATDMKNRFIELCECLKSGMGEIGF
jgi:hypothetical protein